MSSKVFEIVECISCGLRFPQERIVEGEIRCPQCLGNTRTILSKIINREEMRRPPKIEVADSSSQAVLLDNVRSAWNVGSIFRSADGLGFDQVFLCGITPAPENEAVAKTSLGAEKTIRWSHHKNSVELIKSLKGAGWKVFALEEDSRAINIQEAKSIKEKSVLILGSEVTGVDSDLLKLCDEIFYIPMQGEKRSLNVAIAFSIAGFVLTTKK